jgi:hypothetical protein
MEILYECKLGDRMIGFVHEGMRIYLYDGRVREQELDLPLPLRSRGKIEGEWVTNTCELYFSPVEITHDQAFLNLQITKKKRIESPAPIGWYGTTEFSSKQLVVTSKPDGGLECVVKDKKK